MKKTLHLSLFLVSALMLLTMSCKKEPADDLPNNPPDATMKDIQITLPEGANYDLTDHEVMAGGVIQPVSNDGKSKASYIKGTANIAYLFDKDDNVVMAGFITDSSATISTETTAKVILFYATSAAFSVDTIANMFINKIGTVPEAAAWIQNFSATWKANPLAFSKGTYMSSLNTMLKEAIGDPIVLNIRARTSDVQVDDGDIRSGIQVFEDGLGQISIHNFYRRRAYAFIYKAQFKKEGSVSYTDITPATLQKELPIDATAGVTSTVGTVVSWGIGKGVDFGITKNGPVTLDLNNDESEAIYKVRVIGPGSEVLNLSNAESYKRDQLISETFMFDFLMPAIAMGIGALNDVQKDEFVKAADAVVKITPGVYDELKKGNFLGALNSVLKSLVETDQSENLLNLVKSVIKSKVEDPKEVAKKAAAILLSIDGILQGSDFIRIGHDIAVSKQLEEWKVVARSSKIRLNPKEKVVLQNGLESFEVTIKNLGPDETNISYEWTTSGKYGTISDDKGHTGTSFTSTDKKVKYRASGGTLTDGDNWEYIYVKAFQAGKDIGSDTAKVNVKKNKQLMKPDGITLTGKKGNNNANEVRLYLELPNREVVVKPNTERDYKVVWTTDGKYGKLLDAKDVYSTTLTAYDDNGMAYECQDDQAKNKEEIIKARIYSKAKSETEYTLFDEVTGKVKIDNDEKKRIIHVPLEIAHKDTTYADGSYWCYKFLVATFAEDKDAKSYSLKFFDVGTVIGAPSGDSWLAGKAPYYSPWDFVRKGYDGSNYTVYRAYGYGGGWSPHHVNGEAEGWAEVIITLK